MWWGLLGLVVLVAATLIPDAPAGADALLPADPRVEAALQLLDSTPDTHQLRGILDSNHVGVEFLPMSPGIYARYSVLGHIIQIDPRWTDTDAITLAAVIAHEATHAQDAVSGYLASGGAGACLESEVRAFRISALFWIDEYGSAGKAEPSNDLERQLNAVADQQQRDPTGLANLVRQTYQDQCNS